ncbi:hypothetical protein [Marinitoga lauensis]|uniref:hypothetical protein n=1 Tax=Marinitoga lauensis TaxID=2201189 RepID=UPI0010124300|nr:hypothetical protein [Marinitoga lauensis]
MPEKNWFILSHYNRNKKPSILSVIDCKNGKMVKTLEVYYNDGTPYTGHAGGVAVSKSNLWISSNSYLWRIPLQNIINAKNGTKIKIIDGFNTGTRASFVEYSKGILWSGEFYHAGNYPTNFSHHLNSPDGNMHYAWIAGFKLDPTTDKLPENKSNKLNSPVTPDIIISIPDIVQDIEFLNDGRIVLSRSYGRRNNSSLQIYSSILNKPGHAIIQISGKTIPLWFLDKKNIEKEIIILPMSEGITQKDNSLYILFESAATKYISTGKYPTDHIWKLKLNKKNF